MVVCAVSSPWCKSRVRDDAAPADKAHRARIPPYLTGATRPGMQRASDRRLAPRAAHGPSNSGQVIARRGPNVPPAADDLPCSSSSVSRGEELRPGIPVRSISSSRRYRSPASIRFSRGSVLGGRQFAVKAPRCATAASQARRGCRRRVSTTFAPSFSRPCDPRLRPDEHAPRHRHDVAALLERVAGGDERAALLRRLDDDDRQRRCR